VAVHCICRLVLPGNLRMTCAALLSAQLASVRRVLEVAHPHTHVCLRWMRVSLLDFVEPEEGRGEEAAVLRVVGAPASGRCTRRVVVVG
jgi:hypothetical protein